MAKVSLVSANLAALCVGSVLYGIFFVLAVLSIYLLVLRRREIAAKSPVASAPRPIYLTPIIVAAIAISITITGHWIVTVVRLFDAFVNFDGGARPAAFYGEQSQPTQVVKTVSISITFLIADVMLIYRLWIVWGYNYLVIIFPACTVLGLVAAAVGTAHSFATCPPDTTIFTSSFKAWLTAEYVFTFTTNVYCSLFIAWRVWRAHIESREYGATSLMGLIAIIVESAALYTSWTIASFASYQSHSNLQFTGIDTLCPIAGIAFMLINVRVAMGWAQKAFSQPSNTAASRSERLSTLHPVTVDISSAAHLEYELGSPTKTQGPSASGEPNEVA